MNKNIKQIYQNIIKNLSIVGIGLVVFNTISTQTTINSLRESLNFEKEQNSKLINEINILINNNTHNKKLEEIISKNNELTNININKLETLNTQINEALNKNMCDDNSVSKINNTIKEINNELVEIINKIDNSLNNNFIDNSLNNNFIDFSLITDMVSYFNNLNYFQNLAITYLFAIMFIFLSLTSLISLYFGEYLIIKFEIETKYPRIYKFIKLRRKFQTFYLIKDLIIIFITLIVLAYLNIMLFIKFS